MQVKAGQSAAAALHGRPAVVNAPVPRTYIRRIDADGLLVFYRRRTFFLPAGAEALRRDNPNAAVQLLETGHFALETHVGEIALATRQLLAKSAD